MAEIVHRAERISPSTDQLSVWHSAVVGSTLRFSGACPVCRHQMAAVVPPTGTVLEGAAPVPLASRTVAIGCNCGREHKGQPPEPKGCGRTWSMVATEENGVISLQPADDPYLTEAAEAWRASQSNQLDRLRAAAEKWTAGISALLGVVSAIGLSSGAEQIRKLSLGGRLGVLAITIVFLMSGGFAILQAYRAAYGWPRTRRVVSDDELLAWYGEHNDLPVVTAARLRTAVVSSIVAIAAVAVGAALTWFLPESASSSPMVKATLQDQSTLCGALLDSQADGMLVLRLADRGSIVVLPVTRVVRLSSAESC